MKIPIYYSFIEFLNKWENDYLRYKEVYPNCSKKLYLDEIFDQYSLRFFDETNSYVQKYFPASIDEVKKDYSATIFFNEFCDEINSIITKEIVKGDLSADKIFMNLLNQETVKISAKYIDTCIIRDYLFCFTITDKVYFDIKKFKDFEYSIELFFEYFEKFNEENKEIFNCEHSEVGQMAKKERRLFTPVVFAVLNELGVFAEFKKRNFNRADATDVLYQIIGTNKKNIEEYYDDIIRANGIVSIDEARAKKAKSFLNSKGL